MKYLVFSILFFFIPTCIFGQSPCDTLNELIDDDFEGYEEGPISNQSELWSTLSGISDGEEEGVVSSLVVNSGSQSLAFGDAYGSSSQNALLSLTELNEGMAIVQFSIYVVPFFSARIAGLHSTTIPSDDLAFILNFGVDGSGSIRVGGEDHLNFTYNQDEWINVRFVFDFDNDFVSLSIDHDFVFGWPLSLTSEGQSEAKSISSLLFQTLSLEELFFIDDVQLNTTGAATAGKYCHLAKSIDIGVHSVGTFECYGAGFTVRDNGGGLKGEWYSFMPSSDGILGVGSCEGGEDTRVWIFSGGCEDLVLEGVNDDQCLLDAGEDDDYASYREVAVNSNETYFIVWDDVWEDGNFDFELNFTNTDLPSGNFCESAITLQNGEVVIDEIDGHASVSGPDINHTSASTTNYSKSEWYTYTPENNGLISVASCFFTEEDTRLWVYTGSCGFENLKLVASDDDGCELQSIIFDFPVEAGVQYFFEWDNEDFESQGFTFLFEFEAASTVNDFLDEDEQIKVYPNPSSGDVYIDFQLNKTKDLEVNLLNNMGQVIHQKRLEVHGKLSSQLKMDNLPSGLYYIEISDGTSRVIERLLIN